MTVKNIITPELPGELTLELPEHGGDLGFASQCYGISLDKWLDLSTGINPDGYPIPQIPQQYFQQLPQRHQKQALIEAAKTYYQCENIVVGAGSQQFIELLPQLHTSGKVAMPDIGYREHLYAWSRAGYQIIFYDSSSAESLQTIVNNNDVNVVIVINPCNPAAIHIEKNLLLKLQQKMATRGGWLIVDEAFADVNPMHSISGYAHLPGVIVLRSLGKLFGLAGIRIGFLLASKAIISKIEMRIGLWPVSLPSLFIATQALLDKQWQYTARKQHSAAEQWLFSLLQKKLGHEALHIRRAGLFVSVILNEQLAIHLYQSLASQGIWVRYWDLSSSLSSILSDKALLRFGLVSITDANAQEKLINGLAYAMSE